MLQKLLKGPLLTLHSPHRFDTLPKKKTEKALFTNHCTTIQDFKLKNTNTELELQMYTHPKTNIAPQKWWLEDYFPIGKVTNFGGYFFKPSSSITITRLLYSKIPGGLPRNHWQESPCTQFPMSWKKPHKWDQLEHTNHNDGPRGISYVICQMSLCHIHVICHEWTSQIVYHLVSIIVYLFFISVTCHTSYMYMCHIII